MSRWRRLYRARHRPRNTMDPISRFEAIHDGRPAHPGDFAGVSDHLEQTRKTLERLKKSPPPKPPWPEDGAS